MRLEFNLSLAEGYKSRSQKARVLTEDWVKSNAYCPKCGRDSLNDFSNNLPVADFYCLMCREQFELKSKQGNMGLKIVDGAYRSMIERITSSKNPNFFFLTYNITNYSVKDFLIIPKHFFTERIIEKRKPLSHTAKRAGWVGCNINLENIPETGKIFYVKQSQVLPKEFVLKKWESTSFLNEVSIQGKGWLLDILDCLEKIPSKEFRLNDVYAFEDYLKKLHPENRFVKDKIRQQLQILRDKGYVKFMSRGVYKKTV